MKYTGWCKQLFPVSLALIIPCISPLGCGEHTSSQLHSVPTKHATNESSNLRMDENAIVGRVAAGMSHEQVIRALGEPLLETKYTNGTARMIYRTPQDFFEGRDAAGEGNGVVICLSNNVVITWQRFGSASEATHTNIPSPASDQRPEKAENALQFFVLSKERIPGSEYISTKELPDLGYVKKVADLEIRTLLEISIQAVEAADTTKSNMILSVMLPRREAELFHHLTENHLGERILISVDGIPIAAPLILEPVKKGEVRIQLPAQHLAEETYRQLQRLKGSSGNGRQP